MTSKRERRGGREAAPPSPSPFPPLGVSVARGLWAVGASPVALGWAFLSLLAAWGVFVALGVEATPRFLAVAMAISPAHLFFTDVSAAFRAGTTVGMVGAVVGLALFRSVTFGLLTLLVQRSLLAQGEDGPAGPDLPAMGRRLLRAVATLVPVYVAEVGLVVVVLQLVAGFLGPLSLLAVAAALYFLAFIPLVAVVEGASFQEAVRRGFRAARLPGTRHLILVMVYFLLLFYAASVSPFGLLTPATPSVLTWAFAMVTTFIHAGVLGALVYRWLAVRDQVPAGAPAGRSRSV